MTIRDENRYNHRLHLVYGESRTYRNRRPENYCSYPDCEKKLDSHEKSYSQNCGLDEHNRLCRLHAYVISKKHWDLLNSLRSQHKTGWLEDKEELNND